MLLNILFIKNFNINSIVEFRPVLFLIIFLFSLVSLKYNINIDGIITTSSIEIIKYNNNNNKKIFYELKCECYYYFCNFTRLLFVL